MEKIGLYSQLTEFTNDNAGTAEWCKAERDGKIYFVKKFQSPVYPAKTLNLPENKYEARVKRFHKEMKAKETMYQRLSASNSSGILVVPVEVMNYQYHICTVSEFVSGNMNYAKVYRLSEWHRLMLMRTLMLALMNVHKAGVVHSDLKPENVMLTQDSSGNCRLRLIDFDGSFFTSEPPETAEKINGDPAYFAPEVLRKINGEDIRLDEQLDIFALGLIFHIFWCGKLPEKPVGRTVSECLLTGEPVMLSDSLPPEMKRLVQGMLETDPGKRLKSSVIYQMLGEQLSIRNPPTLERSEEPVEEKKTIQILSIDEKDNRILKSRSFLIRKGEEKWIEKENISGYSVLGLANRKIKIDWDTKSPVYISYKKKKGSYDELKYCLIALLIVASAILLLIYFNNNRSEDRNTTSYPSLSVQPSVPPTNPPARTPAQTITPTPSPVRSFEIEDVSYSDGITTVRWKDSEGRSPYEVSYQYNGVGNAKQSNFWAGGDSKGSTTSLKTFDIKNLVAGENYIITIEDNNGKAITRHYSVPFTKFSSSTSYEYISRTIEKAYKKGSETGTLVSFDADSMILNMKEGYSFGLYYKIEIPNLKTNKNWFTQIFIKAPNGYAATVCSRSCQYEPNTYMYWDCLGDSFFENLYEENGTIPTGQYSVELYFDGMWVGKDTFIVE